MQEIWKSVVGYDGYLEVSSMGRIRSVERTVTRKNGTMFSIKPKVLTPQKDKKSYLRIRTSIDGNKFTLKVHRVVAEAFLENPDNKKQVDHIDGNKENNIVENLRWVNNRENFDYSIINGLRENSFQALKESHNSSERKKKAALAAAESCNKITLCYSRSGELIATYKSAKQAAIQNGINASGISSCCTGRLPTYKNYIWKYANSKMEA